jgi:outer membrane protein assembly factor BamB
VKAARVLGGLLIVMVSLAATSSASPASVPRVVASFRVTGSPQAIVAGGGGVWVTTLRSLVRLDPRTNRIGRRLRLNPILGALTISGSQLWLARNPIDTGKSARAPSRLRSVNAVTGRLSGPPIRFQLIANLEAAASAIWVTNGDHAQFGRLFKIDPRRRKAVATLKIPGAPSDVVEERGLLWVACSDTGYLYRVQPRTATLAGKPIRAGKALLTVAAGRGRVWVGDSYAGAVNSVDANTGKVVTRTKLRYVSDVAAGEGAVWATVDKPSELVRLDPSDGHEVGRPLPIQGTASGLAIGFGSIWVITSKAVIRVQP